MFVDLHIHSWYSDGTLSPAEIVEKAKAQNISLISICDHNLIDAYKELHDIQFINGVEINSVIDDIEYHILAYGFDMRNKALNELLEYNRSIHIDKGIKLIENISVDYPSVTMDEFSNYKRNRKNGGWESIDYLKSKKVFGSVWEYFDLVSKYGEPPDKEFLPPAEIIKIIREAGGYAVIAHIGDYPDYKKTAIQFLNMGIDGFECYYPLHTAEIIEFIVEFCRERDLIITAGSDEHGRFSNLDVRGYYIGAVKVKLEQLNLKGLYNARS